MADKKDFLASLAEEVEDKKKGLNHPDTPSLYQKSERVEESEADYQDIPEEATPKTTPMRKVEPQQEAVTTDEGYGDGDQPASFGEEELQKVEKKSVHLSGKWIALIGVILLALGVGIYFLFFAPKIEMPDFVGQNINDVGAWAKQQGIDTTTIIRTEQFSMDYDAEMVMEQNVAPGTKVGTDVKLTFVVSKGADPDETVDFPDIKNMTYDEIKAWVEENKLAKTKITTTYSDTVAENAVISYDLKNVSENNFTRGSTLNIVVSRGMAPAGQVAVTDFKGKTYEEMQVWANTKKITLEKTEAYSDTIEAGKIISQSAAVTDTLKEGDTITVVVSKGKGVTIPNLVGFTEEQLTAWSSDKNNTVVVVTNGVYSMQPKGNVVKQSIPAGSKVDAGSVVMLDISLYMPIMETNSRAWLGKDFLELQAWCDGVNNEGADIQSTRAGEECSDEFPTEGQIVAYWCEGTLGSNTSTSNENANACGRPLGLGARISYKTSTGACTVVPTATPNPTAAPVPQHFFGPANAASLTAINTFCNDNAMNCTYQQVESYTSGQVVVTVNGKTYDSTETSGETATMMLPEGTTIDVKYRP